MSDSSEIQLAESERYNILRGPNGLRAGWRLLIFAAIFSPLYYAADRILDSLMHRFNVDPSSPLGITIGCVVFAVAVFLASWIMAKIEGRSIADYGLPWRRAFCRQFWQGAAISFASLTIFRWYYILQEHSPLALQPCMVRTSGNTARSGLCRRSSVRCWRTFSTGVICCSR
jgi:hypothetical protein